MSPHGFDYAANLIQNAAKSIHYAALVSFDCIDLKLDFLQCFKGPYCIILGNIEINDCKWKKWKKPFDLWDSKKAIIKFCNAIVKIFKIKKNQLFIEFYFIWTKTTYTIN